jgi:spermidine synthase
MALFEHDGDYSIRVGGLELMSTRQSTSEERMAELGCEQLGAKKKPRILIGGLGFGFTLRSTLRLAPKSASVTVSELMPAVIAWNKNSDLPLAGDAMKDPRVRIIQRDVMEIIATARGSYDAILLDVDNGPSGLCTKDNDEIYGEIGLHQIQSALAPGGSVVFWSAAASPIFAKRLSRIGFEVNVTKSKSHGMKGSWHTLFVGRRPK